MNIKNIDKYQSIKTIDLHTAGEPLRLITEGVPEPKGQTILEKRRFIQCEMDWIRKILMYEPRGHQDMYGALITEPEREQSDFGIIFMHNEGYSSMCGHGIIAVVTAMVECGRYEIDHNRPIHIDSPAGLITAFINPEENGFTVSFECVPSFVSHTNIKVKLADQTLTGDICFGGAYYLYVDADQIKLPLTAENIEQVKSLGQELKCAATEQFLIQHPKHQDLSFLYGTLFYSNNVSSKDVHSKHICIFAESEVDRSPTGTGVSGRIALLKQRGEIEFEQTIKIESVTSASMSAKAKQTDDDSVEPVIPFVTGSAYITGEHRFLIDNNDPLKAGFLLR